MNSNQKRGLDPEGAREAVPSGPSAALVVVGAPKEILTEAARAPAHVRRGQNPVGIGFRMIVGDGH